MGNGSVAVLVFAKPPRPGSAKTRLGAGIGDVWAARLAEAFLVDTFAALARYPWVRPILSTPEPAADHGVAVEAWDQCAGPLAHRLHRGFARALEEHATAVALGADSPGLPDAAFNFLRTATADAALGPTDDGGFWGLRLSRCPNGLFDDVPYSTERAAEVLTVRLRDRGLTVATGPRWWDVDVKADLDRLAREVPRDRAPATFAVLDAMATAVRS